MSGEARKAIPSTESPAAARSSIPNSAASSCAEAACRRAAAGSALRRPGCNGGSAARSTTVALPTTRSRDWRARGRLEKVPAGSESLSPDDEKPSSYAAVGVLRSSRVSTAWHVGRRSLGEGAGSRLGAGSVVGQEKATHDTRRERTQTRS